MKKLIVKQNFFASNWLITKIYILRCTVSKTSKDLLCRLVNGYQVLVGKPEGKRPLGRTRRRWEDNIKMDLQEVRCGGMD